MWSGFRRGLTLDPTGGHCALAWLMKKMQKTSLQPRFWEVPSEGGEALFDVFAPFGPDFGPGGPKNALFGVLGLHPRVFTCKNGQKVDFATRDLVFSTFGGPRAILCGQVSGVGLHWIPLGVIGTPFALAGLMGPNWGQIGPFGGQLEGRLGLLGPQLGANWAFWDPN